MPSRAFTTALLSLLLVGAFALPAYPLPVFNGPEEGSFFVVRRQSVRVEVFNHLARTTVTQEVTNSSARDIPCRIVMAFPKGARASGFCATVDGVTYHAEVRKTEVARAALEKARKERKTAALAEELPDGKLQVELSQVKAGSSFNFTITYIERAAYRDGWFHYDFAISSASPELGVPESFGILASFRSTTRIEAVESPSHSLVGRLNERSGVFEAEGSEQKPDMFSLRWKLALKPGVPEIMVKHNGTEDPYFSLLMLPPGDQVSTKGRAFSLILDKSGSMEGMPYLNAVASMVAFIKSLREQDLLNVTVFDNQSSTCAQVPFAADSAGKQRAVSFVEGFSARGGTRFLGPLSEAAKSLKACSQHFPVIILFTDGHDNVDRARDFVDRLRSENALDVPIFAVGFGKGVDEPLLRTLSSESGASFIPVSNAGDIGPALAKLGAGLDGMVGRFLEVGAADGGVYKTFPSRVAVMYRETPISMMGRLKKDSSVLLTVKAETDDNWAGASASLSTTEVRMDCDFLDQMWAAERIQELMDEIRIFGGDVDPALKEQVIELSTRFLLTSPYTSLVFSELGVQEEEPAPNSWGIDCRGEPLELLPGDGTLGALGVGAGSPTGAYGSRRGSSRAKAKGGSEFSENAMDLGLKWLADNQGADGHWDAAKWGGDAADDVGTTGLALLTFAGAGHTEKSGKYRRVVQGTIRWLEQQQDANGCFAPDKSLYNHAIATLALLEEVAMAPVPRTKAMAEKALEYLLSVQNKYSAWGVKAGDTDSELTTTVWCLKAMKAATFAGIEVAPDAWTGVMAFVDSVTDTATGEVGRKAPPANGVREEPWHEYDMTARGMHARLLMGQVTAYQMIKLGVTIGEKHMPEWDQPGYGGPAYEYWYFMSLVLFQVEGDVWKAWRRSVADLLRKKQKAEAGPLLGSWDPDPNHPGMPQGGRVASTAYATLVIDSVTWYDLVHRLRKP